MKNSKKGKVKKEKEIEIEITEESDPKEEKEEKEQKEVYCICRGPDSGGMICCDSCEEWYHWKCINMKKKEAESLGKYFCIRCREKEKEKEKGKEENQNPFTYSSNSPPLPVITDLLSPPSPVIQTNVPSFSSSILQSTHSQNTTNTDHTNSNMNTNTTNTNSSSSKKRQRTESTISQDEESKKKVKVEDKEREKIRNGFASVFGNSPTAKNLAKELEAQLYLHSGKEYKKKYLTLIFNLKRNEQLRNKLLRNEISPEQFCKLNYQDLANEQLAQYRREFQEKQSEILVIPESSLQTKIEIELSPLANKGFSAVSSNFTSGTSFDPITSSSSSLPPVPETRNINEEGNETSQSQLITRKKSFESDITSPPSTDKDSSNVTKIPSSSRAKISNVSSKTEEELEEFKSTIGDDEPFSIPSFTEFSADKSVQTSNESESITPPGSPSLPTESILNPINPDYLESGQTKYIWKGHIRTSDHKVPVKAFYISGDHLQDHFPESFMQVGRMDLNSLNTYLDQLSFSSSRKISLIYFLPLKQENIVDYNAAFESFKSKDKAIVIKDSAFRESFLVPISRDASLPSWSSSFSVDRSEIGDVFIGVFITDKQKSSHHKRESKTKSQKKKQSSPLPSSSNVSSENNNNNISKINNNNDSVSNLSENPSPHLSTIPTIPPVSNPYPPFINPVPSRIPGPPSSNFFPHSVPPPNYPYTLRPSNPSPIYPPGINRIPPGSYSPHINPNAPNPNSLQYPNPNISNLSNIISILNQITKQH